MNLAGKYEVLDLLTIGPAQVFRGKNLSNGAPVVVHLFQAVAGGISGESSPPAIVAALQRLSPDFSGAVLDSGVDAASGYAFVVVNALAPAETPKPASGLPPEPKPQSSAGGEFTQLFQSVPLGTPQRTTDLAAGRVPAETPDLGSHTPSAEAAASRKPGRFTGIFGAPAAFSEPLPWAAEEKPSAQPRPDPKPEPAAGESRDASPGKDGVSFTDMFSTPGASSAKSTARDGAQMAPEAMKPSALPVSQAPSQPGPAKKEMSFTDAFRTPASPAREPVKPPMPATNPEPSRDSPHKGTPGELPSFTGIFGPSPIQRTQSKQDEAEQPQRNAPPRAEARQPDRGSEAEPTVSFVIPKPPPAREPEPTIAPVNPPKPAVKPKPDSNPVLTFQSKLPLPDRDAMKPIPPGQPAKGGGEYSDLFADLDAPGTKPAVSPAAAAAAKADTGSFTKLFGSPVQPGEPDAFNVAPPKQEPGSFTQLFASPVKPLAEKEPSPPSPPIGSQEKGGGSFTRLFSTPAKPGAGKEPFAAAPSAPAPEKDAGGFTQLFSTPKAKADSDPFPSPPSNEPAGGFTQIFGTPYKTKESAPAAAEPKAGGFTEIFRSPVALPPEKPKDDFPPAFGGSSRRPAGSDPFADFPREASPVAPARPAADANATQLFQAPPAARPQAPPPAAGPSEFTRIIKGSEIEAAKRAMEAGSAPVASAPGAPPAFAVPAMPGVAPPPIPKAPPPPAIKPPAVAMPAAPPPPKIPAVEPKKVSYMPLIIILNVLFVLAVILVLVLWLKK